MAKYIAGGVSEQILLLTREIENLKQELMAQGDQVAREALERRAEVDRLKIEIAALKKILDQKQPGFIARYQDVYEEERQKFDPELEKQTS